MRTLYTVPNYWDSLERRRRLHKACRPLAPIGGDCRGSAARSLASWRQGQLSAEKSSQPSQVFACPAPNYRSDPHLQQVLPFLFN